MMKQRQNKASPNFAEEDALDDDDDVDIDDEDEDEEEYDDYEDEDEEDDEEDDDDSLDESDLLVRNADPNRFRRHSHSHSSRLHHQHHHDERRSRSLSAGSSATSLAAAAAAASSSSSAATAATFPPSSSLGKPHRSSLHQPTATAENTQNSLFDGSTIAEGDEDDGEDEGAASDSQSFTFSGGDSLQSSAYAPYGHTSSSLYDTYSSLNDSTNEDSRRGSSGFSLGSTAAAAIAATTATTPQTDLRRDSLISVNSSALGIIDESTEKNSGMASAEEEDDDDHDEQGQDHLIMTKTPPNRIRRVSWDEIGASTATAIKVPTSMDILTSSQPLNNSSERDHYFDNTNRIDSIENLAAAADQIDPLLNASSSTLPANFPLSDSLRSSLTEDRSVSTAPASSSGRMQRRQATLVAKQTRASSMDMIDFRSNSVGRSAAADSAFGSSTSSMPFVPGPGGHKDSQHHHQLQQQISMGRSRVQRRRSFTISSVAVHAGSFDDLGSAGGAPGPGGSSPPFPGKSGKGASLRQTLARKTIHRNAGGSASSGSTSGMSGPGSRIGSSPAGGSASAATTASSGTSQSPLRGMPGSGVGPSHIDRELAIANLEGGPTSEWEGVAAAAAVVQTDMKSTRHHRRYAVGDRVLVRLAVLNITFGGQAENAVLHAYGNEGNWDHHQAGNFTDRSVDNSTLKPVNKHGYPPGEGETSEEKEGPFVFVLATVKFVHFEEDARYYTVTRADTTTDQRADTEWMEPIISTKAELAALRAARTTRDTVLRDQEETEKKNPFSAAYLCGCFHSVIGRRCISCYQTCRRIMKNNARAFLYGNDPFAFRLRFTGVNIFVCCAVLFVLIDQIRLGFVPASSEKAIVILSCVVWSILVVELFFEILIRPEGYNVLTTSEKAYAPSTARFINSFHLMSEALALVLFVPNFRSLVEGNCDESYRYSLLDSSLKAVLGPTRLDVFIGYLFFASIRLRIFGLVRHWKKMWINHTFVECKTKPGLVHGFLLPETRLTEEKMTLIQRNPKPKEEHDMDESKPVSVKSETSKCSVDSKKEDDRRLNKAATIGTALMVVNSHRAMLLIVAIVGIMPLISTLEDNGGANQKAMNLVSLLQANNVRVPNNDTAQCDFLYQTTRDWVLAATDVGGSDLNSSSPYLLWAQVLPVRCNWQRSDGIITNCTQEMFNHSLCEDWEGATGNSTPDFFAEKLGLRSGVIVTYSEYEVKRVERIGDQMFNVTAMFNHNQSVQFANRASFLLQTSLLFIVLIGLTVLRGDAGRLVIDPLRRMLKIVLRYAENPLTPTPTRKLRKTRDGLASDQTGDTSESDSELDSEKDQLGNYETEQLINAIAKITDLLRKCWGVAGAGIISTNLARTEDGQSVQFNATVPGKRVYALFAFAGIKEFGRQLRALDQEVMILINDVAKVVHDEVFRWGLGDSGQCNKNLGAAFLMVFRIGDFKEVEEKRARALDVVFSSAGKRRGKKLTGVYKRKNPRQGRKRGGELEADTLQLATLPGIQAFTDRALLGMLKSYAGIHRDQALMDWKKDFRLGAGVGAFSVDMIFGMDAGWAVEGAVGSAYKIDATYLSPHVNMASRMMSACKQYGVSILLSQAVQELLSEPAKSKLRHIDTVTVKGTTVEQRIFTYDARHQGVDFFLYERTVEQADLDSERYSPKIWTTDQDLQAMRRHVTEDFEEVFATGRELYLDGQWGAAVEKLKEADKMMITSVIETGYVENDTDGMSSQILDTLDQEDVGDDVLKLRNDFGDGPSRCLISFIEREGGVAPQNWRGVRPLKDK